MELSVTQKPDLPDFYFDRSISFNAKLSSDYLTSHNIQQPHGFFRVIRVPNCLLSAANRLCQVGQILEN